MYILYKNTWVRTTSCKAAVRTTKNILSLSFLLAIEDIVNEYTLDKDNLIGHLSDEGSAYVSLMKQLVIEESVEDDNDFCHLYNQYIHQNISTRWINNDFINNVEIAQDSVEINTNISFESEETLFSTLTPSDQESLKSIGKNRY